MILAKTAWLLVVVALGVVLFSSIRRDDGVIIVKSAIMATGSEEHTLQLRVGE